MFIVNERDEPGKKIFLKMIREKHCKECQVEVKHCDKSKEKWWYLLVLDRVEEVEFYMGCEMLPAELQKGSEADPRRAGSSARDQSDGAWFFSFPKRRRTSRPGTAARALASAASRSRTVSASRASTCFRSLASVWSSSSAAF